MATASLAPTSARKGGAAGKAVAISTYYAGSPSTAKASPTRARIRSGAEAGPTIGHTSRRATGLYAATTTGYAGWAIPYCTSPWTGYRNIGDGAVAGGRTATTGEAISCGPGGRGTRTVDAGRYSAAASTIFRYTSASARSLT